jgi:hypothetical protein
MFLSTTSVAAKSTKKSLHPSISQAFELSTKNAATQFVKYSHPLQKILAPQPEKKFLLPICMGLKA